MSIPFNPEIAESHKFPVANNSPDNPNPNDPDWITYEAFVCALVAPMDDKDNIHHMATGISGEGGELLDCSKKTWVYKKPLDRENMLEELGDLEWYMAGLRQMLGVSRHEVLAGNIRKLQKRYVGGYSDAAAIERADKQPSDLSDVNNKPKGNYIWSNIDQMWKELTSQVIDVTSPAYIAANPPISDGQVAMVDEQAEILHAPPIVEDWCLPLLASYHAGKKVQAISYSKNTATVLFVGDSNPYKLYKPKS